MRRCFTLLSSCLSRLNQKVFVALSYVLFSLVSNKIIFCKSEKLLDGVASPARAVNGFVVEGHGDSDHRYRSRYDVHRFHLF